LNNKIKKTLAKPMINSISGCFVNFKHCFPNKNPFWFEKKILNKTFK
jgi:hypothetical protein